MPPPPLHQVHLLVRKSELRASKAMVDRVLDCKQITVHWNTTVLDAYGGSGVVEGLTLSNLKTGGCLGWAWRGWAWLGWAGRGWAGRGWLGVAWLGWAGLGWAAPSNVDT